MDLDSTLPGAQDKALTVLGLESSCDETAAAIVRLEPTGCAAVLAEAIQSQNDAHAPYGGVVPEIAARAHVEIMDGLVERVLTEADLSLQELDGIAATSGPGLVGGVMAALMTAKGLALGAGKPLIAVNHLEGHALSPRLSDSVAFPYLLLLVSGGHTQLLVAEGVGRYHRLGSTLDDAAGEAFDKTAKILGLGFPGGPALEQAATNGNPDRFDLPTPLNHRPGCDFSFAGLKTAVRQIWENLDNASDADKADLAAGLQKKISESLANRSFNAMKKFIETFPDIVNPTFVVAGGVAANKSIRCILERAAQSAGFCIVVPPVKWCTDNAAMIALAGAEHLARGETHELDEPARARWPLDAVSAKLAPAVGSGRKGPKA